MVLGEPIALIAEIVGTTSETNAPMEGIGRRSVALYYRGKIKNGYWNFGEFFMAVIELNARGGQRIHGVGLK